MRADQILDQQVDLFNWLNTQQGNDFILGFTQSLDKRVGLKNGHEDFVVPVLARTVGQGTSYYLTGEIKELLLHAAAKLPDETLLQDVKPPGNHGFIQLESPLTVTDIGGIDLQVYALGWSWILFNDEGTRTPRETVDGYGFSMWTRPERAEIRSPYDLLHVMPWSADMILHSDVIGYDDKTPEQIEEAKHNLFALVKFFFTFFAFIEQKVPALSISHESPSRAASRRAQRAIPQRDDNGEVQIVDLRRRESHSEADGESHVAWTHRWITEGHWRRQWYPSIEQHKTIYINDHVKGPSHLPLVVKNKVYRVAR